MQGAGEGYLDAAGGAGIPSEDLPKRKSAGSGGAFGEYGMQDHQRDRAGREVHRMRESSLRDGRDQQGAVLSLQIPAGTAGIKMFRKTVFENR